MNLPKEIEVSLALLQENGYEAFVVGGCVRDAMMGKAAKDFDVTTSALPKETCQVFAGYQIIETGIKHGTVTVIINSVPIEITSYRIDGEYTDNRHPDRVSFTRSLREDLSRRDFTMNAICYSPKEGFVDYFGGRYDIENKTIRAVGDANQRFCEDALRILRAIRFSAVLGFTVEAYTAAAIHKNKELLHNIAVERLSAELNKILLSKNVVKIFQAFIDVFVVCIPELLPMVGFEQNNPHHCFDVFTHTLMATQNIEETLHLRLAMLLHDIGKPCSYESKDTAEHFYGHAEESVLIAEKILTRLHYDTVTKKRVLLLVKHHDLPMEHKRTSVKKYLSRFGEEMMLDLLKVKKADCAAQHPAYQYRLLELEALQALVLEIISERECFSLKNLAVDGRDLIALGIPEGIRIGEILHHLLDAVINGEVNNAREPLLHVAKALQKTLH